MEMAKVPSKDREIGITPNDPNEAKTVEHL